MSIIEVVGKGVNGSSSVVGTKVGIGVIGARDRGGLLGFRVGGRVGLRDGREDGPLLIGRGVLSCIVGSGVKSIVIGAGVMIAG